MIKEKISEKTYKYYYNREDLRLAYWILYNRLMNNNKVQSCSCSQNYHSTPEKAVELVVTYK